MNSHLAQELLNRGIVTDEQLAPYRGQAGNASIVRWRATRVRLERVVASATEAEEKAFEKLPEQAPKAQTPSSTR